MESKTIKKSIHIAASGEKLWDVLTHDDYTRSWYAIFCEGTHADTDWKPGSKVTFTDSSGNGLAGKIAENKPGQILSIEYTGIVKNGVEDYESQEAKDLQGGHEIYRVSGSGNNTLLEIACDMNADYFDFMSSAWEKALDKIRVMAESN